MLKRFIDVKLFVYLTTFYTVFILINLTKKSYFKLNHLAGFENISWYRLIFYNVIFDWISVIVFMVLVSQLTKRMFEKKMSLKIIILIHLFLSFFISYFVFFVAATLVYMINGSSVNEILENLSLTHFFMVVEFNFLIYFTMLGIITVYYYIKKVKNIELQRANLQASLADAKLNYLKSQINPHFVFNTLNSISSLVNIDKEKSQDMITNFGDLFRDILDLQNENLIPIHRELEMLDKYIEIISVRFEDHISFKRDINDNVQNILIPALLIQPIIENSVKHGYSLQITDIEIGLKIYKENNMLNIMIDNNGKLLSYELNELFRKGLGLKNIDERLKALYGEGYEFIMLNKEDDLGVKTIIKIPIQYQLLVNTKD